MKIDKWIEREHSSLDAFKEYWTRNMLDDRTTFHSDMSPTDWDEEYSAWVNSEKRKIT